MHEPFAIKSNALHLCYEWMEFQEEEREKEKNVDKKGTNENFYESRKECVNFFLLAAQVRVNERARRGTKE